MFVMVTLGVEMVFMVMAVVIVEVGDDRDGVCGDGIYD